ncbi:MAG: hypothetical protein ACOZQL_39090 [Myxococcota bacterium]
MIYATEYRGLKGGRVAFTWEPGTGSTWCALDDTEEGLHRKLARRLRGRGDVECSSNVRPYCTKRGWEVTPAPEEVRRLAAGFFVAEELRLPVSLSVSAEAAALVTACERFLVARPWRRLARRAPLELAVDGAPTALASVLADGGRGPGLLLVFPPRVAHGAQLVDHLIFLLDRRRSALSARLATLHAPAMHPWFQLTRGGRLFQPLLAGDVRLLTGALEAIVSFDTRGRGRGGGGVSVRAVSGPHRPRVAGRGTASVHLP